VAYRPLPKDVSFSALEEEVLERWRERDVFCESMRRRHGAEPFVFYEGRPTERPTGLRIGEVSELRWGRDVVLTGGRT
jgi:isoleucyl-tRNA synthetase